MESCSTIATCGYTSSSDTLSEAANVYRNALLLLFSLMTSILQLHSSRYIERFRFGKPQSREERQHQTADGGVDQPFWWMSTSPPSSSTPTQTSEKHIRGVQTQLLNTANLY